MGDNNIVAFVWRYFIIWSVPGWKHVGIDTLSLPHWYGLYR